MAGKQASIEDLPDELLLNILSHFGPEELCLIIANVCKKWNDLSKDMLLWKTLSYKCDKSSDPSLITMVLTAAPALESLTINDRMDVADIMKCVFDNCRYLRKLFHRRCHYGEVDGGLLQNIVDLYPNLEVLSLKLCRLTSAEYSLIPQLKNLSELELWMCEELCGNTVRLIADSCRHLTKLSLLGMRQLDDNDVIQVIDKLGEQLTTLVLDGVTLTDVAYLHLNNCARLKKLAVNHCTNMTDRGLLEGIGPLHELTSLDLAHGFELTARALSTFLNQPSMTSIVSLNLSGCSNLDDEGVKGIAKRCIDLRELKVGFCHSVTDDGISMVIRHCNRLQALDLSFLSGITGEGWLALVPSNLPHLRRLCLGGCDNVRDRDVEELEAAAPELDVIH